MNYLRAQQSILPTRNHNKAAQNIDPSNATGRFKRMKEHEKRMQVRACARASTADHQLTGILDHGTMKEADTGSPLKELPLGQKGVRTIAYRSYRLSLKRVEHGKCIKDIGKM